MLPLLEFEPSDYITPLLHLLIGIVNKGWDSLCHFLDEFVEHVSQIEASLKDSICEIEKAKIELDNEIDIHTVNRDVASLERQTESEANETYHAARHNLKVLLDAKKKTTLN